MQRKETKTGVCKCCRKRKRFTRYITAMGCGDLFMVLITFGLWVLFRAIFKPKFRCEGCGSTWRTRSPLVRLPPKAPRKYESNMPKRKHKVKPRRV